MDKQLFYDFLHLNTSLSSNYQYLENDLKPFYPPNYFKYNMNNYVEPPTSASANSTNPSPAENRHHGHGPQKYVINYSEKTVSSDSDNMSIKTILESRNIGRKRTTISNNPNDANSRIYECLYCPKSFRQRLHMDGHLLTKHKDISEIEKAVRSKIHYCSFCQYRTINTYNLTLHMKTKHGKTRECESKSKVELLECNVCSYSTYNKGNMLIHLRIHQEKKHFQCCYCERSFNQKVGLKKHYLGSHNSEDLEDKLKE